MQSNEQHQDQFAHLPPFRVSGKWAHFPKGKAHIPAKKACLSMSQTTNPRSTGEGQEPLTHMNPRIILLALGMFAIGTDAFIVAGVLPVIA